MSDDIVSAVLVPCIGIGIGSGVGSIMGWWCVSGCTIGGAGWDVGVGRHSFICPIGLRRWHHCHHFCRRCGHEGMGGSYWHFLVSGGGRLGDLLGGFPLCCWVFCPLVSFSTPSLDLPFAQMRRIGVGVWQKRICSWARGHDSTKTVPKKELPFKVTNLWVEVQKLTPATLGGHSNLCIVKISDKSECQCGWRGLTEGFSAYNLSLLCFLCIQTWQNVILLLI
jgi:hypothetical protein